MDSQTATALAEQLHVQQQPLCKQVAQRMLRAFPELGRMMRLEECYTPTDRLSQMAVERLNELVRAVLLFELPALADSELVWAHGVLPRHGVTYEHQVAMIRWFFEEVRRLTLSPSERELARELENYFLQAIGQVYAVN